MSRSGKRKISHQTGRLARRVMRRRVRYMKLSLSKMSDLQKSRCEDMRVHVLLKNTYLHLKNNITTQFPSWGQGESAHDPTLPNGMDLVSPVGEHHLQDGGMGPELTVANSKSQNAGDLPRNAPQALASNLEEEEEATSIQDPWPELHCDTFFGNFQVQDDLFSDIEMSEFESVTSSVANGGEPSEEVKASPLHEGKPLSDQEVSGIADLDHFVELLINAE
ncbi:uncharacterized protein LOC103279312 [Anolis carolinensis]|uniref:uncharacterized protein LOC103279312 n=1 Tax=Anolis carolinensis TaxID=28377 RepID=UPI000462DAC1|nr:PREDICTED: uncharacterized protein LOC103279312 [Anolis carolinensis]XP_008112018.1 PREDICTED: uncharacterized protein LOC103279312 [Anolis carolinensis]|eukprot:XP_008112017.1 PREDICTED: uncharacterized protein LOC103279312 [Anolis carolinensis]